MKLVIDHILKLQNYIQSLEALQIDSEEFAYLKALVLFSPGKWIYMYIHIIDLSIVVPCEHILLKN